MKKLLIIACIALAGCAGSQAQQLLTACESHDAFVRAMAPQAAAGVLSQRQVDAVDQSIVVADGICDGTAQNFSTALARMEAELLRMTIIGGAE